MFDNIAEQVFQQTIETPRGTGCTPLLADMFLHAYEADFFKLVLNRTLVQIFASSFGNIDDVSSLNNSRWLHASNLPKISLTYSMLLKLKVCFLTLPSPWNRQRRNITSKTLRQTWWLLQKPTSTISYKIPATPLYCVYVQFRPYVKVCNQ